MFGILRFSRLTSKTTYTVFSKVKKRFVRTYQSQYFNASPKIEDMLKKLDGIPKEYKMIYRDQSSMAYATICQLANLAILAVPLTVAYLWSTGTINNPHKPRERKEILGSGRKHVHLEFTQSQIFASFAIIVAFGLVIRRLSKKCVFRVYRDPSAKKYSALMIGDIPFSNSKIDFLVESVKPACDKKRVLNLWRSDEYVVNGTKMFLFQSKFRTMRDWETLTGSNSTMQF